MIDGLELDVVGGMLPASLYALAAVGNSMIATPCSSLNDFALLIP